MIVLRMRLSMNNARKRLVKHQTIVQGQRVIGARFFSRYEEEKRAVDVYQLRGILAYKSSLEKKTLSLFPSSRSHKYTTLTTI